MAMPTSTPAWRPVVGGGVGGASSQDKTGVQARALAPDLDRLSPPPLVAVRGDLDVADALQINPAGIGEPSKPRRRPRATPHCRSAPCL